MSCCSPKDALSSEKTRSTAAEDGCIRVIFFAAADQLGSVVACSLHHCSWLKSLSISAASAR